MDDIALGEAEQIKEALRVLDATLRGDLAFDSDSIARIEKLFRALPDEKANKDLVQGDNPDLDEYLGRVRSTHTVGQVCSPELSRALERRVTV